MQTLDRLVLTEMFVEEPDDHLVNFVRLGQSWVERKRRVPEALPDMQICFNAEIR